MDSSFFVELNRIDAQLLIGLQKKFSDPSLDQFFSFITDLHKQPWFILVVLIPLLGQWLWRERRAGAVKLGGLVLTLAVVDSLCGQVIKKVFARERPFVLFPEIIQKSPASGYGFVSNHAANMACVAFFLSHYYPRWTALWWSIAGLIGLSRIYNGVHFVSDVVVGSGVGILIAWLMTKWLDRRIKGKVL